MKLLCSNKFLLLMLFFVSTAFAGVSDKSAIVYYGKNISYPMVGIHDYIIVQPAHTNVNTHGFEVYKDKMYAYVSIGEIDKDIDEYKKIKKEWILGSNKAWNSPVLDLGNPEYKAFLFDEVIEPQMRRGFKNFFFDTLDSYQLVAKTKKQRAKSEAVLVDIIKTFHKRYPNSKLIINRGFEILDKVHNDVNAVLFESYYNGISGEKLSYEAVSDADRKWLDIQLQKIHDYKLDLICVDYLPLDELTSKKADTLITKLQKKGCIPYIATKDLNVYGKSSKNPVKREVLTLIDESEHDRVFLSAHQHGALPLEYQGYIQKLYDIHTHKLPSMEQMQQYSGVVIWFSKTYKNPTELINWILQLQKYNIKVVFAATLPLPLDKSLEALSIKPNETVLQLSPSSKIVTKDAIMGYEIEPSLTQSESFIDITQGKSLLTLSSKNDINTTYAAIMPWGGFALRNGFMQEFNDDNLWVVNPFEFFTKALRLRKIPAPDVTTEYGKRIFVSHIDGDGSMNRVEWNPKRFSIDVIYKDVLKKYPLPMSASIVGAEDDEDGLYPELAPQLQKIIREMYKLPYVEPATHTFSHPFFWDKIHNGDLDPKYRLAPKGYQFSLENEFKGMIDELNVKYITKEKRPKAKTVFWSGDCAPPKDILAYVYKLHLLNYNGGDTYITNTNPWLSYIAPLGLGRGEYYQIYTGEQDENVYTGDWHGPFWGFKKVVQTFKLTENPRRLKIIDLYYHYYSGSKRASLNALYYIYDWVLKQDINPMFTSLYIPKVMDFYTLSLAEQNSSYFLAGARNLKTLRLDESSRFVNIDNSENVLGLKKHKKSTYIHLGSNEKALIELSSTKVHNTKAYLVSTNAAISNNKQRADGFSMELHSFLPITLELRLPKGCRYHLTHSPSVITKKDDIITFKYKKQKRVGINVVCKP